MSHTTTPDVCITESAIADLPPAAKLVYIYLQHHSGPATAGTIKADLQLAWSTTHRSLSRLEDAGLVRASDTPSQPHTAEYEPQPPDKGERVERPAWAPGDDDNLPKYSCDRCGHQVGPEFYRVWEVDGDLDGCPMCLPRSVRYGEDVYGRDRDEAEVEFREHEGF